MQEGKDRNQMSEIRGQGKTGLKAVRGVDSKLNVQYSRIEIIIEL